MSNPEQPGSFSYLDRRFAEWVSGSAVGAADPVCLAAALTSRAAAGGNVCLDLQSAAGRPLEAPALMGAPTVCPPLDAWIEALRRAPAVGAPGQKRPLILEADRRLYLYRYWEYESTVAHEIHARATAPACDVDRGSLAADLERFFPAAEPGAVDWQKTAAAVAALKRFCVITGGPGTGKTFTIARILAILAGQPGGAELRVKLAAPTGKAAARLREALRQAREALDSSPGHAALFADEVTTLHRLLRPVPNSPYFHYNRRAQLPLDLLVVDEASMVDLALMAKLLEAVPSEARLIVVGDKDQLASVEAGSVLGDICGQDRPHGFSPGFAAAVRGAAGIPSLPVAVDAAPLGDCIVELRRSYRFAAGSAIGELSRAVNRGEAGRVLDILSYPADEGVGWLDPGQGAEALPELERRVVLAYARRQSDGDPRSRLGELARFRILCAHRSGPFGVESVNRLAERNLIKRGAIRKAAPASPWYDGRPVLITQNDYALSLFNGDIGIALQAAQGGGRPLWVYFPGKDGETRRFPPHRLPPHETVYAMTVHKSQGSEFDEVLLVLPARDSPVLTRELVYTALTRARSRITLWGGRRVLQSAVSRRIERASGLREALWGPDKAP